MPDKISFRSPRAAVVRGENREDALKFAFFWLTAFYFVYCARPQDYLHILDYVFLAKVTGLLAFLSLLLSLGRTPRTFRDLPAESFYLLALIVLLFVSAFLSPVWRGGAFFAALDFAKVYILWILTFMLVTNLARFRRIIFVQAAAVALIALVAIVKGHNIPRLNGVVGGFYSNPNDMAFAIVLSLPFCAAFLLSAKNVLRKLLWCSAITVMLVALLMTASRAGFIDFVIAGVVCLWHFGIRGKRPFLVLAVLFFGVLLLTLAGGPLIKRFAAISGEGINSRLEASAYGSYEERKELMGRALGAIVHYPVLGVGAEQFIVYSGLWKEVHASYLQIAAEGGIPAFVLYILFFGHGFANLRRLGKSKELTPEQDLFYGALRGSLIGFVVGACFAPEAYQYFPYLTVCYTSVLLAMVTAEAGSQSHTIRSRTQRLKSTALLPGRARSIHAAC